MTGVLDRLATRFARVGLNVVGAANVAAYDACVAPSRRLAARAPDARTAVVVGSGGRAFWDAFRAAHAPSSVDPLDRFTRDVVGAAIADVDGARAVFPFDAAPAPVDFQALAELAGLGRRSLVGVLVHPEYGPWFALRAAVLVRDEVRAPRPADGFDPCPACTSRPCIAACPAGAVGPQGWDVPRCAAHRLGEATRCAAGCHARLDCVYGRAHRYPPEALAFHQAAARDAMARYASASRKT